MKLFWRAGETIETEIEPDEVDLLDSLAESLIDLLGGDDSLVDTDVSDPLAWLEASVTPTVMLDHSDPLIDRLFPDACPTDRDASRDLRRFTEDDARRARIEAARVMRDDLAACARGVHRLSIADAHADAWLKTLNAFRLSLSVRLGITDERSMDALARLSARDPRAYQVALYEWLGEVLESFVMALHGPAFFDDLPESD